MKCDCTVDCGDDPAIARGAVTPCRNYHSSFYNPDRITMDNQHRAIKGYRELSQAEIDLMNEIKGKSAEVGDLVAKLKDLRVNSTLDQRWIAIGATHLQEGFMALTRGVAKPDFF